VKSMDNFYMDFEGQYSPGFNPSKDLERIGVVNQTTMLASDTQAIADFLKETMIVQYELPEKNISEHFADTRDTLCYATNDNQSAVSELLSVKADLAVVIGGYNSSNTSHLVELCEEKLPTYFIQGAEKIISRQEILHYDFHKKNEKLTNNYLPEKNPLKILMTSGASCPDALVEGVIRRLAGFFSDSSSLEKVFSTV
jgi:4-hydroxy-3-methylbut-2-en-1-yl diphosphate reductase